MTLLACGGGDDSPHFIDAGGGGGDGGGKVCTAITSIGNQLPLDVTDEKAGSYIEFITDAGDVNGDPLILYIDFYHSMVTPSIPTSYDPSTSADNLTPSAGQMPPMQAADGTPDGANLKTCAYSGVCIYALQFSPDFMTINNYYMSQSGSVTFTADPVTSRNLDMTTTGLKLQQLTVDDNTGLSMFNPAGNCQTLSLPIAHTNVPNDWTCDVDGQPSKYYTAEADSDCDCGCGVYDPDCFGTGTTNGCSDPAKPVCWPLYDDQTGITATDCIPAVANDTCADATTLVTPTAGTPTTANGTTIGAKGDYNKGLEGAMCAGYKQEGPDVAYKIPLTAGDTYTFTLDGLDPNMDMGFSLVGPGADTICNADIMKCVAGHDEGYEGDAETFDYTVPSGQGGNYYLIVDSYYTDHYGMFTVTVTLN